MGEKVKIKNPIVQFAHDNDGMIAMVTYEGTLSGLTPVEAHIDTQHNRLTMIFNNGQEVKIQDLPPESARVAHTLHDAFNKLSPKKTNEGLYLGFFEVDKHDELTDNAYFVPALVI